MDFAERGKDLFVGEHGERVKVTANSSGEECWVLRYHDDALSEVLETDQTNINIIDEDLALLCLQSSEERQGQRTLASTCPADNTDLLTRQDLEGDVLENLIKIRPVACAVVDEFDRALAWPVGWWPCLWNDSWCFLIDIEVFLDTLNRVHVLLVSRVQTHEPQHIFCESNSVGQRKTGSTCINLADAQDDKGTSEE